MAVGDAALYDRLAQQAHLRSRSALHSVDNEEASREIGRRAEMRKRMDVLVEVKISTATSSARRRWTMSWSIRYRQFGNQVCGLMGWRLLSTETHGHISQSGVMDSCRKSNWLPVYA